MKIIKKMFMATKNTLFGLRLSFSATKLGTTLVIINLTLQRLPLILSAYSIKMIINIMTDVNNYGIDLLILWVSILIASILITNVFESTVSYLTTYLQRKLEANVDLQLIDTVVDSNFEFYDNPDNLNALNMFQRSWGIFNSIVFVSLRNISSIISLVTIISLMISFSWVVTLIVIISVIPSVVAEAKFNYTIWQYDWANSSSFRKSNIIFEEICDRNKVLEMKLYNNFAFFKNEYFKYRKSWFDDKNDLMIKHNRNLLYTNLLQILSIVIVLVVSLWKFSLSLIKIGDIQYFVNLSLQIKTDVSEIMNNSNSILLYSEQIRLAREFLDSDTEDRANGTVEISDDIEIEFKDVSFKYPNTEKLILSNCSFKINKNDRVAIVGYNGAGKSTIVKLILGFYKPTSGQILINNHDINEVETSSYFNKFSVVFQDYNSYNLSFEENIIISDIERDFDEKKFENACELSGLKVIIPKLTNGVDTQISKSFDESGFIPSKGEMQKIAIARSIYKQGRFVILDEPLASLDPEIENEIFNQFYEIRNNKTSLLISHRLSNTVTCNNIIVLDKGRIAEQGDFDHLMEREGLYRRLFDKQSDKYIAGAN